MNIIHIMIDDKKFIPQFIEFINKNFWRHKFLILDNNIKKEEFNGYKNIILCKNFTGIKNTVQVMSILKKSDLIYIHGLFNNRLLIFLLLRYSLLKKVVWVAWGGDFYNLYLKPKKTLKELIVFKLKQIVSKRVRSVCNLTQEDNLMFNKIFKVNRKYIKAIYMVDFTYKDLDTILQKESKFKTNKFIRILIGNSASVTNEHFEIIRNLSKFANQNVQIICPLSYGDMNYAKDIINYGQRIFKERFIPIRKMISSMNYNRLLNAIDILVFNHKRQQGLGVSSICLYLGKKVFIRNDSPSWDYYRKELGVTIFDTNNIQNMSFNEFIDIDQQTIINNRNLIRHIFSDEYILKVWNENFIKNI